LHLLKVENKDKPYISPSIQAVFEGSRIFIVCYSDRMVTFNKNGKKMSPGKTITLGNTLILYKVTRKDAGVYNCQGSRHNKDFEAHSQLLVGGNSF